jgi:hypothetical protein
MTENGKKANYIDNGALAGEIIVNAEEADIFNGGAALEYGRLR